MKNLLLILIVCCVLACTMVVAHAATVTFSPPAGSSDLGDLNHSWYYSWGISWQAPTGATIQSATLYIDKINNWRAENNDALYIRLLNNPAVGVAAMYDGQTVLDQWRWSATDAKHQVRPGYGTVRPLIALYRDRDGVYGNPEAYPNPQGTNLAYSFDSTLLQSLNNFASDGSFGFGFDPDCHYFNSGVRFEITTSTPNPANSVVPEPVSMVLGCLGMGVVTAARRLRRK
ncbi:MAG: hypothetical protein M1133_05925 [Armatimonadetes bacterium]|nr:hypothetical protein [Armatimonadota bacterium]